ncbi:MAG: Crp/Fnr family transcriptional regulator [Pyrinomonadaceae bacterium]
MEAQTKFYNLRKLGIKGIPVNAVTEHRNEPTLAETLKLKNLFSNQILTALPDKDFARLLPHLQLVSLSSGEELCHPGGTLRYIYFPENAVISYLHVLADGNSTEIAMMGRESIVGLPEVFGSYSSPYCTQVTVSGNALRINAEILRNEFWRCGMLQKIIYNNLNSHLAQISQKVVCNIHHQAESRFCTWLLMLQDRVLSKDLKLTQDQIARYLGVHRPSITHIAQALRERGIINYVRSRISILNRRGLEKIACECYLAIKEPSMIEFAETIQ